MSTKYYLFSVLLLLSFAAFSQKAQFEFFSTKDGLAGNATMRAAQDADGFIWFINNNKVHRYDGQNFLQFPSPSTSNETSELYFGFVSYEDSLLFTSTHTNAFFFEPKTQKWELIRTNTAEVSGILIDFFKLNEQEIVYFTYHKERIKAWLIKDKQFLLIWETAIPIETQLVTYATLNANDELHLLIPGKIVHLDKKYQVVEEIEVSTPEPINSYSKLGAIQFDSQNRLILLAYGFFYLWDEANETFELHPICQQLVEHQIWQLEDFLVEENGNIWAFGSDKRLIHYEASKDKIHDYYKSDLNKLIPDNNNLFSLIKDKTGIIWVASQLGLLQIRPQTYPFQTYFTGQYNSSQFHSFRGFTEDEKGMMYAYLYYNKIIKFDPNYQVPTEIDSSEYLFDPFQLHYEDNKVWASSGLFLDTKTRQMPRVEQPYWSQRARGSGFFATDDTETLWWISHYHLYYLDKSESPTAWKVALELNHDKENINPIHFPTEVCVWDKQRKKLWISHNGQLLLYDTKTKNQTWFETPTWSRTLAIEVDKSGKLWLATEVGLVHFDPATKKSEQFTTKEGLSNDFICGMLAEGDSALWLSTNHGLSRFHIETQHFISFYEKDGLSHNEFNRGSYFKARDGRMYFGGLRGINAFYPAEIMDAHSKKNESDAALVLTAFECTDESGEAAVLVHKDVYASQIELNHWEWSYRFEYALLDYQHAGEIQYSTKMEGYRDSWSAPSKFNFSTYNNLPSGEYTFRVKARTPDGVWHPNQLEKKLVVHPPWWFTWQAYTIYAALILSLIYSIYRFLLRRQELQHQLNLEKEEAQRLAELDGFKSRLYTNLTHEFRTPLTVIIGMATQIEQQPKQYLQQGIQLIKRNGNSLLRLINQLLDLSKLENKSFQLQLQQADIIPHLRYLVEAFQSYANSKNIALQISSAEEKLVMDFDVEQLQQIISNLLSNALKFTPEGGQIKVRMQQKEQQLQLQVSDTGIGIPAEQLPRIFDRFYQVDGSTTREGEGTGIGLAHTQELVKLMGGTIKATSELGKGTTMTVQLPIHNSAVMSSAKTTELVPPILPTDAQQIKPKATAPKTEKPRLLIVEDNPDVVIYLRACLEEYYDIDVAYNGKIGIEKALETLPDLIISDVMMPEKDGFEVCDALKSDERTSHIPIILLTAKADVVSKLAGLKRGADAYLSKPFHREELLVRLAKLIEIRARMKSVFTTSTTNTPLLTAEEQANIAIENAFLQKVDAILEKHIADEHFGLPNLCQKIGMSRSQLFRKMKALVDTSPSAYIRKYRLNRAKYLLEHEDFNVAEAAYEVGFKGPSYFSKIFQEEFGVAPSTTRK